MKKALLIISLYLIAFPAIKAQETPETIASGFFQLFKENKTQQAVELLYKTNASNNRTDTIQRSTFYQNLLKLKTEKGAYCGYELSEQEDISASFIKCVYLIKFENSPWSLTIFYYKPKDKWEVAQFRLTNPIKQNTTAPPNRMMQKTGR